MTSTLNVKVTKRKSNGSELWEGTASIKGAIPTKLTKSKSKETVFNTASAVKKAAEKFADNHGYVGVKFVEPTVAAKVSKTNKSATKKKSSKSSSSKKSETACSAPVSSMSN